MKPLAGMVCLSGLLATAVIGVVQGGAGTPLSGSSGTDAVIPAAADDVVPVEDSMHEFMEYVFQPTYLRLKENMKAEPADNKGWKALKSDSLILAESCNLLYGRRPDDGGDDWVAYATSAKGSGAELYKAAKGKDFAAAGTAYRAMLQNCNACHQQFEEGRHILQP